MNLLLSAFEQRVLGTLIEKDMATPEYCPLSLNALTNACNQKNNREPVTASAKSGSPRSYPEDSRSTTRAAPERTQPSVH